MTWTRPPTEDQEAFLAKRLTNKTGAASIKGTLVEENGIADGDECWIAIYGVVKVLIKDTT